MLLYYKLYYSYYGKYHITLEIREYGTEHQHIRFKNVYTLANTVYSTNVIVKWRPN